MESELKISTEDSGREHYGVQRRDNICIETACGSEKDRQSLETDGRDVRVRVLAQIESRVELVMEFSGRPWYQLGFPNLGFELFSTGSVWISLSMGVEVRGAVRSR